MSPQQTALYSLADYLYFGGAAGGGKTDFLIGLAITLHRKSIIFRREFPQLRDVVERSKEIINDDRLYHSSEKKWKGLRGRRSLEFGSIPHYKDTAKYRGRPHDLKAFDELPEFTEAMFRFLCGWLRTSIAGQRTRVVGAGNPPSNQEGAWVLTFWGPWLNKNHPNPAESGEIRYYAVIEGRDIERENANPFKYKGETIFVKSRTFVKALLEDNPIHSETPDYAAQLQSLPEPLRSQLRYGDFQKGLEDDIWQLFPMTWVQAAMSRYNTVTRPGKMTSLGVDVARGGQDQTVFAPIYGQRFCDKLTKIPGKLTRDGSSVAEVAERLHQDNADINIDIINVGGSAYDELTKVRDEILDTGEVVRRSRAGRMRCAVYPINFGASEEIKEERDKSGRLGFENIRAHAYWSLREQLDPKNNTGYVLPPDPELMAELIAHRWQVKIGKILIDPKDKVTEKIGRSPDCADAVVYGNYSNHMKKSFMGVILQGTTKGWNP